MSQQAIFVEAIGHPVVLGTRPITEPRENEILAKVTNVELNPHGEKIRDEGLFTGDKAPYILTNDIAGTVTRVGPAVSRFRPGDRVFSQAGAGSLDRGGLQQYALVDADLPGECDGRVRYAVPCV